MRRLGLWAACVLGAIAAVASGATADPDAPKIDSIEFPFGEPIAAERWSPVVVRLSSGSRSVQGWLEVTYAQDGAQDISIGVPAATTPGVSVPIELVASVPRLAEELTVRFVSERGRVLDAKRLSVSPGAGNGFVKPSDTLVRLLEVGDTTLHDVVERSLALAPGVPVERLAPDLADHLVADSVRSVGALPHAWLAYQGVDVLVGKASDLARADARARAALLEWVGAGGRLVVLVDGPGAQWKMFVPDWSGRVDVAALADATPNEETMRATLGPRRQRFKQNAPPRYTGMPVSKDELEPLGEDDRVVPRATSLPARLVQVSADGRRAGWRAGWGVTERPGEEAGLVATGPVGMGMVTLVGVDVFRLRVTDGRAGGQGAWVSLLSDAVLSPMPRCVLKRTRAPEPDPWSVSNWNSGVDARERSAMRGALDLVTPEARIGSGVFYGIAGCLVLLGLGIGPLEQRIARRRSSARGHLSRALAWIGVMSAAGLLMPQIMRRGGSVRGVCEVVDVLGQTQWRSGVVSSFSARPERVAMPEAPSTAWRGVSTGFNMWDPTRLGGFGALEASLVLSNGAAEAGSVVLAPVGQPQWTVRTLQFHGAAQQQAGMPRAAVTRDDTTWRVTITDVPRGATIRQVRLATGERLYWPKADELHVEPSEAGPTRMTFTLPRAKGEHWDGVWQSVSQEDNDWSLGQPRQRYEFPGLELVGARDRDDAILARIMAGGYACVLIELADVPDAVVTPGPSVRVVRLLTPIEEETGP